MLKMILFVVLAAPMSAAGASPSEADFPAGYWEREAMAYGRAVTSYNVSIATDDPAKLRAQVEKILNAAGARLTGFNDMTHYPKPAVSEYSAAGRTRQAYTLNYQLPLAKAAGVSRRIAEMGRLITYTTNVPYSTPQLRELNEKIDWIDREQREAAEHLKAMPVSRALLAAKLKSLKQVQDSVKSSDGLATIAVQILREEDEKAAPASPAQSEDRP